MLVPLVAAHADALFPLLADEELWRFMDERAPAGVALLRARFQRWESRRSPDGRELWLNWALDVRDLGIAGTVQATVRADRSEASIGYTVGKAFWGRGFATEAVRLLVAFLRGDLATERVVATVDEANLASLCVLRHCGFALVDAADPRNVRFELEAP
jgi:RimJ/RimL family protein N-acetyltransferase